MIKNITITTHRNPEQIEIEPSPMNDGMYIVYEKVWRAGDLDYLLLYTGYVSVQGLADFINW